MNLVESYLIVCGSSTTEAAQRLNQETGNRTRPTRIYDYYYGKRKIPYHERTVMTRAVAEHFGSDLAPGQLLPPGLERDKDEQG